MTDIEKVIKGLEHCSTTDGNCQWADHAECPYIENCKAEKYSDLDRDALELLKEQKQIVKCKDCKNWQEKLGYCDNTELYIANGEWFCADGERKDENAGHGKDA